MDVSLGALRDRILNMRAWDSSGDSFDKRVNTAINNALDRMAGDVPEALIPSEEHVVLLESSQSSTTDAYVKVHGDDKRVLIFVDASGSAISLSGSSSTWRPEVNGTWDGVMHLEVKDLDGRWHRRQSREWWASDTQDPNTGKLTSNYFVTLDRPWQNNTDGTGAGTAGSSTGPMEFRVYQPEFFVRDDIMEVLEPARVYDSTRAQVWAIDTGGASRFDMNDFQGVVTGRPLRMWRGRHFNLPAPTEAPTISTIDNLMGVNQATLSTHGIDPVWAGTYALKAGKFKLCYTYVWGRRDPEWQQSPAVGTSGHDEIDSDGRLYWAHDSTAATGTRTRVHGRSGISDPTWESAPSPIKEFSVGHDGVAPVISATNIDAMLGFADDGADRYRRSGMRLRFYVSHISKSNTAAGSFRNTEVNEKFHLLCEVEPTFDELGPLKTMLGESPTDDMACRFIWNGHQLYDYERPLKHSTGYYAYKVYPHQDARYELDLRVLRLPLKLIDDRDTPPIQRDAVPGLVELALYYVCLLDGADQQGAAVHLDRYEKLSRRFRTRYANPGNVVEPVSLAGGSRQRIRFGTFDS